MDFTVGTLVMTILLLVLIGNSLYVYLICGVVFNIFNADTIRQVMTAIINIFLFISYHQIKLNNQ